MPVLFGTLAVRAILKVRAEGSRGGFTVGSVASDVSCTSSFSWKRHFLPLGVHTQKTAFQGVIYVFRVCKLQIVQPLPCHLQMSAASWKGREKHACV